MNKKPGMKLVALAVGAIVAPSAVAKTTYVEVFGDDGNPCTKSEPCVTLHRGVMEAAVNGRVIVGPGTYPFASTLTLVHKGLKIHSVSGADSTVLDVGNFSPGVNITGDKVRFGQKRKGFTILADTDNGQGIRVSGATGVRIESNILKGQDSLLAPFDTVGITADNAHQTTIRGNHVMGWSEAIAINGALATSKSRNQILDNTAESANCINLWYQTEKNSNKIRGNQLTCLIQGIYSLMDNTTEKDNARFEQNIISVTFTAGDGIRVEGGNPQIRKNLVRGGIRSINLQGTADAVIRDNLLRYAIEGIQISGFSVAEDDPTISGNTLITTDSPTSFFTFYDVETVKKISDNNFLGVPTCPIDLYDAPLETIAFKNNFWGDPAAGDADPDVTSCTTITEDAYNISGLLTFDPSAKPRPVKYKGLF